MSGPSVAIQQVAERLQGLAPQEKRVLSLRFALDGTRNHTLAEVADMLQVTPTDVRTIELGALTKLSDEATHAAQD
jgi:RNA polymerase primary sigma factor